MNFDKIPKIMEDSLIDPFEIARFFMDLVNEEYKTLIVNELQGTDEILNHEIATQLVSHLKILIDKFVDVEESEGLFVNGNVWRYSY